MGHGRGTHTASAPYHKGALAKGAQAVDRHAGEQLQFQILRLTTGGFRARCQPPSLVIDQHLGSNSLQKPLFSPLPPATVLVYLRLSHLSLTIGVSTRMRTFLSGPCTSGSYGSPETLNPTHLLVHLSSCSRVSGDLSQEEWQDAHAGLPGTASIPGSPKCARARCACHRCVLRSPRWYQFAKWLLKKPWVPDVRARRSAATWAGERGGGGTRA